MASCGFVTFYKGFTLSHLCIYFVQDNKKQLKTKRFVLKRVSQRFAESCGFSPRTPVSSRKEIGQGSLDSRELNVS